ncbi:MAG: hypothetical protein ABIQ64_03135 [Candidatus Saccharimonadales bacterium]
MARVDKEITGDEPFMVVRLAPSDAYTDMFPRTHSDVETERPLSEDQTFVRALARATQYSETPIWELFVEGDYETGDVSIRPYTIEIARQDHANILRELNEARKIGDGAAMKEAAFTLGVIEHQFSELAVLSDDATGLQN